MLLEIKDLHVHYGAIHALKGITLHLEEGEMVSLIGPNGAGKSTLLRTLSGLLQPTSGKIFYRASPLPPSPHQIVREGLAQVPEGRLIFQNMSVKENLELGAFSIDKEKKKHRQEIEEMIFTLFPRLKERLGQSAGTLSGGEQQMLAIGRALMAQPRLLLLDEPSLGLAPALTRQIFRILVEIHKKGTTIFLVEQDAVLALETSTRSYVLETGTITMSGASRELRKNPDVKKAYLGG